MNSFSKIENEKKWRYVSWLLMFISWFLLTVFTIRSESLIGWQVHEMKRLSDGSGYFTNQYKYGQCICPMDGPYSVQVYLHGGWIRICSGV